MAGVGEEGYGGKTGRKEKGRGGKEGRKREKAIEN